jgi:hypothetical protein
MKRIIVAIPHSHTWFWTQTCLASLAINPPKAEGYDVKVIVIDNSPWSPSIKAMKCDVIANYKSNKFHASALDCIVETYAFDYLMALETDVMALRPTWLQWFVNQMRESDYAVGMWHHEQFVNPSCTLYRGNVLRNMLEWCKCVAPQDELLWGPAFFNSAPLDNNLPMNENLPEVLKNIKSWVCGPFAEKRGWPSGTVLKEKPSGQEKGPGWYEPGQQLHHWAVECGYTYSICQSLTTTVSGVPVQTLYGTTMPDPQRQLYPIELFGNAETVHLWGGTRALDIIKHPVTCEFVKSNTPGWLAREARFWKQVVPLKIQIEIMKLIQEYGWHYKGNDRDKEAVNYVKQCYEAGGVTW